MNYILQLELKNKIMREGLKRLRDYADCGKFNYPDDHMNIQDLRLRLAEIESEIDNFEDTARFCPNYDCGKHGVAVSWTVCGNCGTETELLIDALNDPESTFS
jgi:hypothetical protein